MKGEQNLGISLLIIRISVGLFFLVWAMEKILHPELAKRVFSTFYRLDIPDAVSVAFGILQLLVVLTFMAGILKTWSYGLILGMHTASTISTYERLLNPYEPPNHLFWAAIPVLGALIALFLLRESDRLFSLAQFLPTRNNEI